MNKKKRKTPPSDKTVVTADSPTEEPDLLSTELNPQDLEKLPKEKLLAVIQASRFSGPLPPPDLYKEYEAILSGSADRILAMAEKEQNQRHRFDNEALSKRYNETRLGQIFGGAIAVICVSGAVFCAYIGEIFAAALLLSPPLISLVSKLIKGRHNDST